MKTIYIFLDIDGVLVKEEPSVVELTLDDLEQDLMKFDADCLRQFENVIRKHQNCKIVISSSWRELFAFEEIKALFSDDVAKKVVGVTPISTQSLQYFRYHEILDYLKQHHALDNAWIAIDDISEHFPPNAPLVETDPNDGFDDLAAEELDDFLSDHS